MSNQQAINVALSHKDQVLAEIRDNVPMEILRELALGEFDPEVVDWDMIKPLIVCISQVVYSESLITKLQAIDSVLDK